VNLLADTLIFGIMAIQQHIIWENTAQRAFGG